MKKEYHRNKEIAVYGAEKVIDEAIKILDALPDLEGEMLGHRLLNEGDIRIAIQDAIDAHDIKATILVDGNTVYPYAKTIQQYERLKKSGTLEKLTDYMYQFFHLNFDIAHYDKNGYTLLSIEADGCVNKYMIFNRVTLDSLVRKLEASLK